MGEEEFNCKVRVSFQQKLAIDVEIDTGSHSVHFWCCCRRGSQGGHPIQCIFIFISIVIHAYIYDICECWNKIIELNY